MYHIFIKVSIALTAEARLEGIAVFDMADRGLGEPLGDIADGAGGGGLKLACEGEVALSLIAICLIFADEGKVGLVVEELRASAAVGYLARDRLHFERHKPRFSKKAIHFFGVFAVIAEVKGGGVEMASLLNALASLGK